MSLTLRPATPALLESFYGARPLKTSRSLVAIDGERVVAVAGLYKADSHWVLYSELNDELRASRRTLVKGYRTILSWAKESGLPVFAVADPAIKGSDTLLHHMGFQPASRDKRVYEWVATAAQAQ